MLKDKRLDIKLCRVFNIFNKRNYKTLWISAPVFLIFIIWGWISGKTPPGISIPSVLLAYFISLLIMMIYSPKRLVLYDDCAKFCDFVNMPPKHGTHRGYFPLKVQYYISDISETEFHQTPIEKLFNAGHVVISGKVTFEAKRDLDRIKVQDKYYIYGIRNFSEFKKEFETAE